MDAIRRSMPLSRRVYERLGADGLAVFMPEAMALARGETLGVYDSEPCDQDDDGTDRVIRVEAPDPGEQVETARCAQAIHAAMSALTVQERMILRGIFFDERPLRELAAELGISISYVSRVHTRALGRLKTALEAEWGYEPETARPWVRAGSVARDWIEVALEADASGQLEAIETEDIRDTEVANAA
jgi:RNA polymerase sigma factor for flagellar operon FliA